MGIPNHTVLPEPRRAAGAANMPAQTDGRAAVSSFWPDRGSARRSFAAETVDGAEKELAMGS